MTYSKAIEEIMPLVNADDSTQHFIVFKQDHEWQVDYADISDSDFEARFAHIKKKDPYALMHIGSDFAGGSYSYAYDTIISERLTLEDDALNYENPDAKEFIDDIEDAFACLSPESAEYIANLDKPMKWISEIRLPDFTEVLENKIAEKLKEKKSAMRTEQTAQTKEIIYQPDGIGLQITTERNGQVNTFTEVIRWEKARQIHDAVAAYGAANTPQKFHN
jgi:hypothetical protein